ncbi:hypothetical protein, partial [Paraburkholderia tropica]|uniref:hypothetical protein n=1 Tax=Paraburkholderia tropica TaxID=92647 RepID=UPI001E2E602C
CSDYFAECGSERQQGSAGFVGENARENDVSAAPIRSEQQSIQWQHNNPSSIRRYRARNS